MYHQYQKHAHDIAVNIGLTMTAKYRGHYERYMQHMTNAETFQEDLNLRLQEAYL